MPQYICKLNDRYFVWSTVVDAPITYGMTREDLEAYYEDEYGRQGLRELPARLARVDAKGVSSFLHENLADLVEGNRAGPGETEATLEEIADMLKVQD